MKQHYEITEDELALWKEQPVTVMVLRHLDRVAERAHQIWLAELVRATPDKEALYALQLELKAKLEFITDFKAITIEDIHDSQGNQRPGAEG